MKKPPFIIAACLIVLTAASLFFSHARVGKADAQKPPAPVVKIPDAVKYSAFFHFVVDLNKQAEELERAGKDGSSLRMHIQIEAEMDYPTMEVVNKVATGCIKDIDELDSRAVVIIAKFRAQFPGGKVPVGEKLPPPPPELKELQAERDRRIMAAWGELDYYVGTTKLWELNDFINREIAPNIRPSGTEKR